MLDTLQSQRSPLKPDLGKTGYEHFVLARSEFLKLVGAPNDFLRFIIINYMFKYTFGIKITLLESLRNKKKPFNASISAKLRIITLF